MAHIEIDPKTGAPVLTSSKHDDNLKPSNPSDNSSAGKDNPFLLKEDAETIKKIKEDKPNQISPADTKDAVTTINTVNMGLNKDNIEPSTTPGINKSDKSNEAAKPLDHLIKAAELYNTKLNDSGIKTLGEEPTDLIGQVDSLDDRLKNNPAVIPSPAHHLVLDHNLTARIRTILKDNGMDTQQQEKAIQQITTLLFESN